MTSNQRGGPGRLRPRPRSDERSDLADPGAGDAPTQQREIASPATGYNDEAARRRHGVAAEARSRRWRVAIVAVSIFAVVVIAVGVIVGLRLRHAHQSVSPRTSAPSSAAAVTTSAVPPGCDISSLLASMSPRDKLAQLLMVGVTDAADARAVVANQKVGGIFIASWTNLTMLTDGSLKEIADSAGPLHLAVSVDEEGGRVERLSSLIGKAPSARVLAQNDTPDQVYQLALDRGRQMLKLGITIDFAPVVDVTDAADDTVIGDRSFSNVAATVTQYAGEYARGLRDAGVLPVLKHFPGHGHASGDSHATGVTTPSLAEMQDVDLVPYRSLVAQLPVGVMVGHMQVPGLTGDDQASLSPAAIALLRDGFGYGGPAFDGPIFTDDLSSMKAITDRYTISEAVLKALQAGNDTALWVSTTAVSAVLDRLVQAVNAKELDITKVEASVRRMAAAKALNSQCGH
ncbi:MAG: glycoside hydrolase family 3 protein [Mycobacterium sp.]|uniref:glycoside hydrolase family 3 N-terminal domain-containing protein n=1 Tax=Mycobacterium sp. TaxID=1785 RepID=UPI001EC27AFC|nr:glycoside hydrolase family 3 N-terminal domain-containing protein [Mycobacterium sp.]MBW0016713.1 glycoside hydrolase family 3 protein [Mycobacterium sp.]